MAASKTRKSPSTPPKSQASPPAKPKGGTGGGGPTASGGYNYQAAVTAIAMSYAARGAPLGWLSSLVNDVPVSVASETGSGGDDIRLVLSGGEVVDVQVKKGLTKGASLWTALLDLAKVLQSNAAQFAVLVVDGSASGTIREDLSKNIRLLAQGSAPKAGGPAVEFAAKLKAEGLDPRTICERLRIETVSATTDASGDIRAAKAQLAGLCIDPDDAGAAWNRLYGDAHAMQAARWIRNRPAIAQSLRSEGIALRDNPSASPTALLERLCRWTLETNSQFSILGVPRPLSIKDAFIPIIPFVREADEAEANSALTLADAVARYQDWDTRRPGRDADASDPRALGRYYTRCVVVAGPGAGKSTMLSRVATAYAADGYAVLKASALAITRRMNTGDGFEEALFELALDGSNITPAQARGVGVDNWVVLIDGLDEAGTGQSTLVEGLKRFDKGHRNARIILTTRPVGYHGSHLAEWRHYELPSIAEDDVDRTLSRLLEQVLPTTDPRQPHLGELVQGATAKSGGGAPALRTPLMVGLAAALFASRGSLEGSRTAFYRGVLELVDSQPSTRIVGAPPGKKVRNRYLDALGWLLVSKPEITADEASSRVAARLADELGEPPLKAEQVAEECRLYWQALGVIEELRHAEDRALAFVHKTFGEYAAGRFLAKATLTEQLAALSASTDDPGLREVIAFAAGQGLAPVMLDKLVKEGVVGEAGEDRLLQALDILVDTRPVVSADHAEPVLSAAFAALLDDRRRPVASVGVRLHQLAEVYPALLTPRARPLLNHPQPWTRLAALAVCLVADPDLFDVNDWIDILIEISGAKADPSAKPFRAFSTGDDSVRLLQTFAGDLAERIIDLCTPDAASDIFERAFTGPDLQRVGFLIRMEHLIQGRGVRSWWHDWDKTKRPPIAARFNALEIKRAAQATFLAMSRGLQISGAAPPPPTETSKTKRPLYALSAFMEVVDFAGTSLPEIWPLEDFGSADDIRWLWRCVARLADIREDELTRDAVALEHYLSAYDGESLSAVFDRTLAIDIPEPNWSAAPSLPPDIRLLESALRRPSSIVIVPAYEIAAASGPGVIHDLAKRLLANGEGLSLWAGAALAALMPLEEGLDCLFNHATGPLRSGSAHVIRKLASLAPSDDQRRTATLSHALLQPMARAAMAAAEWAAAGPRAEDLPLIIQAYEYWREDDALDRKNSVTTPPSPSAVLFKTMLVLAPQTWPKLVECHEGAPFAIREAARAAFGRIVAAGEDVEAIAATVGSGDLPIPFVEAVLEHLALLSSDQLNAMLPALQHKDDRRRLVTMALLDSAHLGPDDRASHLDVLRKDESVQVRERAASMSRKPYPVSP